MVKKSLQVLAINLSILISISLSLSVSNLTKASSDYWQVSSPYARENTEKANNQKQQLNPAQKQKLASIQVPFTQNSGQHPEEVAFSARTFGGSLFITSAGELVYSLPKASKDNDELPITNYELESDEELEIQDSKLKIEDNNCELSTAADEPITNYELENNKSDVDYEEPESYGGVALRETLVGANFNNIEVTGEERAETRVNIFHGNEESKWQTNLATYNLVSLGKVYDGIEMKLKAYGNNVEKLFFVSPGYNPEQIRLKFEGADSISISEDGRLVLATPLGDISFTKPIAFQEIDGERVDIEVEYVLTGSEYGFSLGEYDERYELVIDPLLASTYLGGGDNNARLEMNKIRIDIDNLGNIYTASYTNSQDYPTQSGSYSKTLRGNHDVAISKFKSDLSQLLASTYIGGTESEFTTDINVEGSSVYVFSYTKSTNYPVTNSSFDKTANGGFDLVISKLNSNLSNLEASTYLGGSRDENSSSSFIKNGNLYIALVTYSSDFPIIGSAYDNSSNGYSDIAIVKMDTNLSNIIASSYLGGTHYEIKPKIRLDSNNNIIISLSTRSSNYPITNNAFNKTTTKERDLDYDIAISKLDNNLSNLLASTYLNTHLNPNYPDRSNIDIDSNDRIFVVVPIQNNISTTSTSYKNQKENQDLAILKLDNNLSNLLASTYLGGAWDDSRPEIAISNNQIYVAFDSSSLNFPTLNNSLNTSNKGSWDIVVAKLDNNLSNLLASTYIGGSEMELNPEIRIINNKVIIAGATESSDYPIKPNAYDQIYNIDEANFFISILDTDLSSGIICGNSKIENPEACDDGNTNSSDGCSDSCQIESDYSCSGEPSICNLNTPPTVSCSLSEINNPNYQYKIGSAIYYNPNYIGSFRVNISANSDSGIEKVGFPSLGTGFSGGSNDYSAAYNQVYSWTNSANTSPGSKTATAYANNGLTNSCNFVVTKDVSDPAGGSITYGTGYITSLTTDPNMTVNDGSDSGSGINTASRTLQRAIGTLSNNSCSSYGSFTNTTYNGTYPNIQDTGSITSGKCYKYRWVVTDRVGNEAVYSSENEIKVQVVNKSVTLTQPQADASLTKTNPIFKFTWQGVVGEAISFNLIVEKYSTASSIWLNHLIQSETNVAVNLNPQSFTHSFTESLTPGQYRYKVEIIDSQGTTYQTDFSQFDIVKTKPEVTCTDINSTFEPRPNLEFTIDDPQDLPVSWQISLGGELIKDYSEAPTEIVDDNGQTKTFIPKSNLPLGTHAVTITAQNQNGDTASDVCSVTIAAQPEVEFNIIELKGHGLKVADGNSTTDVSPQIYASFTNPENSVNLEAQIAIDQNFVRSPETIVWLNKQENLSSNNYQFSIPAGTLEKELEYYWRVIINSPSGTEIISPVQKFSIDSLSDGSFGNIGTPGITSNLSGNKTDHHFSWNSDNLIGWLDWRANGGGAHVDEAELKGYVWNDYLGWIRLNCQSSSAIGISDNDICSTNDFKVINQDGSGTLVGKAALSDFGGYLYFDGASCQNDGSCQSTGDIEVKIDNEGKFSGYAWSPVFGWIDFNEQNLPNFFPVAEWMSDENQPILNSEVLGHNLIPAQETWQQVIALDNQEGDKGFSCTDTGELDTTISQLSLIDSATGDPIDQERYLLECLEPIGPGNYGKINLVFLNNVPEPLSQTSGKTYLLTGTLKDSGGNTLDLTQTDNQLSFQVIAGPIDFSNSLTIQKKLESETELLPFSDPQKVLANNQGYFDLALKFYDQFNNPLTSVTATHGPHQGEIIKEVNFGLEIYNTIDLDQRVGKEIDRGDAINYLNNPIVSRNNAENTDIINLGSEATNSIHIASLAPSDFLPSDSSDQLKLKQLTVKMTNKLPASYSDAELNICEADACKHELGQSLSFSPLLDLELVDSAGESQALADTEIILGEEFQTNIKLTNHSNNPNLPLSILTKIRPFDQAKFVESETFDYLDGLVAYDQLRLLNPANNTVITTEEAICKIEENNCGIGYNELEEASGAIAESELLSLGNKGENSDTYIYSQSLGQVLSAADPDQIFTISSIPTEISDLNNRELGTELSITANIQVGSEFVKFPILIDQGLLESNYLEMYVDGALHGQKSNPETDNESGLFIEFAKMQSFNEMLSIVESNVLKATLGQDPNQEKAINQGETITINNWQELINHPQATVFEDGQIIWFHEDANFGGFTLKIAQQLLIPTEKAAYTLIVQGGNLELDANILDQNQTMSGTGMLGLIVLNSRVNADPSQSGNILINPSVTNIKAFALTERSVLAYSSNTGVFDGFNEDYTQNSKQLYWKGSIASQNTRYATDFKNDQGELAPYLPKESDIWLPQECANHQNFQSSCSSSGSPSDQQKAAQRFDLAKLRKFRGGAENQALDLKEDLEKYSIIIEYNSRLNEQNAPPLFIVPKSIN